MRVSDLGLTTRGSLGHLILYVLSTPEGQRAPLAKVQVLALPTHPENTRKVLEYYAEGGEVRVVEDRYSLTRHGRRVLADLGAYEHE